ncbi:MAG: hypothetical protein JF619_06140 [Massilia sp.]|nr:hypothetical protein [Massilia sp.]
MNFLSNSHKKYFAAVATAFAAIAIPAQATDCATVCQTAAQQAGQAAAQQAAAAAQTNCYNNYYSPYGIPPSAQYMSSCMNSANTQIVAAGNAAYQQTLAQCNGSCH